jgi:hypothetical protein
VIHENEHEERLYQPAMDINKLSISYVLNRLERKGSVHQIFVKSNEFNKITSMLEKVDNLVAQSFQYPIKDL